MPFTPNNSEQRSPPTCYRGCWHVVSRGLFTGYRHHTVIPSGAYSSPAAASRRSLGRISVPMCPFTLSGRIPIIALVGLYPPNKLMGRRPIPGRSLGSFHCSATADQLHPVLPGISTGYPRPGGRSPTRYSPVRHSRRCASTPLAVRLACLRRAASVRSEPGSNSP